MTGRRWKVISSGGSRRVVATMELARDAAPAAIEEASS
jgi:hypothetical protein